MYNIFLTSLFLDFFPCNSGKQSQQMNQLVKLVICSVGYKSSQIGSSQTSQWGMRDPVCSLVEMLPWFLWRSFLFLLNWIKRKKKKRQLKGSNQSRISELFNVISSEKANLYFDSVFSLESAGLYTVSK